MKGIRLDLAEYRRPSHAAMARWMVLACADTPIISEPRQATGRR
jgi:hypothetical protein